ncbi:MAG: hypothetical protein FIB06_00490 [Betaproteobacteria bacterium]|nr:hypothetical protein [Betaproteobacteria bacterium]
MPISRKLLLALAAPAVIAACATPPAQVLDNMEPHAAEIALNRGRFDMQCATAMPAVLGRELAPPLIEGPLFVGVQRGIFTIGVSGCGQQRSYQIICPEGSGGCFSADTLGNLRR